MNNKIRINAEILKPTKEKLENLKRITGYSQGQLIDIAISCFKVDKKIKLVY